MEKVRNRNKNIENMTPKEKADELIGRFTIQVTCGIFEVAYEFQEEIKQCAIICVDELIYSTQPKSRMFRFDEYCIEYWQEVKQEIEKL